MRQITPTLARATAPRRFASWMWISMLESLNALAADIEA
jgi:hypothetical protein